MVAIVFNCSEIKSNDCILKCRSVDPMVLSCHLALAGSITEMLSNATKGAPR